MKNHIWSSHTQKKNSQKYFLFLISVSFPHLFLIEPTPWIMLLLLSCFCSQLLMYHLLLFPFLYFGSLSSTSNPIATAYSFLNFHSYFFLPPFEELGCFSGCLMSSAGIQKLFCGICSTFKCSFNEFVGEKVFSLSYSSAMISTSFQLCNYYLHGSKSYLFKV